MPDPTNESQIRSFHSRAQVPVLQSNVFKKVTLLRSTSLLDPTNKGQIKSFHFRSKVPAFQGHATARPRHWIQPMKVRLPRRRPQHPQRSTVASTKGRRRPPQPTPGRSREPHKPPPPPSCRDLYQLRQIWICTAPPSSSCHRRSRTAERSKQRRAPDCSARRRAGGEGPQIQPRRKSTPLEIGGQTSGVGSAMQIRHHHRGEETPPPPLAGRRPPPTAVRKEGGGEGCLFGGS